MSDRSKKCKLEAAQSVEDGVERRGVEVGLAMSEERWHPDLCGVVRHEYVLGDPAPPAALISGLTFDPAHRGSDPLPTNVPISGSLKLCDVPDSHLDYTITLEAGEMLQNDLIEKSTPGIRRFVTVMNIYETYIPPSHRGLKLGEKLARAAFALAANRGWGVRPSCTYIAHHFIPRYRHSTVEVRHCNVAITKVAISAIVIFSCSSWGPTGCTNRRHVLSKKSVAQLANVSSYKSVLQAQEVDRGRHAPKKVTTPEERSLLIEKLLRIEFTEAKHFFGWPDPSVV